MSLYSPDHLFCSYKSLNFLDDILSKAQHDIRNKSNKLLDSSSKCSAICLSNMTFNESMLSSAISEPATTHVIAQREWRLGKLTRLQQIVESLGLRGYSIAEQFVLQLGEVLTMLPFKQIGYPLISENRIHHSSFCTRSQSSYGWPSARKGYTE